MSSPNNSEPVQQEFSFQEIKHLFEELAPQDVTQFIRGYQYWSSQQKLARLAVEIATLQEEIVENTALMQKIQPSSLSLATLAQLQASGVDDINLLDAMLARGEEWLDHSMQLLERCEELDMIGGNYTEWCQHALEGAYEWIASINESTSETATETVNEEKPADTEALLLHKLMSDTDNASDDVQPFQTNEPSSDIQIAPVDESECLTQEDIFTLKDAESIAITHEENPLQQPMPIAVPTTRTTTSNTDTPHQEEETNHVDITVEKPATIANTFIEETDTVVEEHDPTAKMQFAERDETANSNEDPGAKIVDTIGEFDTFIDEADRLENIKMNSEEVDNKETPSLVKKLKNPEELIQSPGRSAKNQKKKRTAQKPQASAPTKKVNFLQRSLTKLRHR